VKLFWNHQNSVSLQAEKVHKGDAFSYDLASCDVKHVPPPFGQDRGPVIGYYVLARMVNGGKVLKTMSVQEALAWGKKHSKCWDKNANAFRAGTPWADHPDAMGLKTLIIQTMKLVPKSVEIMRAMQMDETVKMSVSEDMANIGVAVDYEGLIEDADVQSMQELPPATAPAAAQAQAAQPAKPKGRPPKPAEAPSAASTPAADGETNAEFGDKLFGPGGELKPDETDFERIDRELTKLVFDGAYQEDIGAWGKKNKPAILALPQEEQKRAIKAWQDAYNNAQAKPTE
jgi:hypothetical protein